MGQYIKEAKRLQQLAGIKEMRLNEPGSSPINSAIRITGFDDEYLKDEIQIGGRFGHDDYLLDGILDSGDLLHSLAFEIYKKLDPNSKDDFKTYQNLPEIDPDKHSYYVSLAQYMLINYGLRYNMLGDWKEEIISNNLKWATEDIEKFLKNHKINGELKNKITTNEMKLNVPGEDLSKPRNLKRYLDRIPNEKYFYIADEHFEEIEDKDEDYDWTQFDGWGDSDLVDYFYDDIFNNELKGKLGIEGDDFYEWQDIDDETNERNNISILYKKIMSIITAYKKKHYSNKKNNYDRNSDTLPLTPRVKQRVYNITRRTNHYTEIEKELLKDYVYDYPNLKALSQEVKDYINQQLKPVKVINEMRLNNPGLSRFPKEDIAAMEDVLSRLDFGSGLSDTDINNYYQQTYDYDSRFTQNFNEFQTLVNKYIGRTFISNEFDTYEKFYDGKNTNKYFYMFEFKPDKLIIKQSNVGGEEGIVEYFTGWFNASGKYIPDTEHFTEDGELK
jgi:hypothetical protein